MLDKRIFLYIIGSNSNYLERLMLIIESIKKIENSLNRIFGSVAMQYGLTGKQFFILGYVFKQSKKRDVTQKDIENFGNVRKSTVSSIISNLEKNGFIIKKPSEKDNRINIILPTEKAYEIERRLNIKKNKVENEIFSCFNKEELDKCAELLLALQKKLKDIAQRP